LSDTAASTDWLSAGRVGKPHGLDGSFHVTRPRWALLEATDEIRVADRSARVLRRAGTSARPILRLDVASTREAVLALRGEDVWVHRDHLPPLGEDEFWPEDLAGCEVRDGSRVVGVVQAMRELPSCEVLEVAREGRDDLLVPMVRDAVRTVDLERRIIDVDLAFLGEEAG
jgi:16S rRNA processing protein RimM